MPFNKVKQLLHRFTDWSHWPHYLFYFPLLVPWLSLYIKSRSLWFFTPSNPTLAFGGFEGEGKRKMYEQLPPEFCPQSLFVQPQQSMDIIKKEIAAKGFYYPFIVKPDVGMKGIMFRKIDNEKQLEQYHQNMPADYIIQEFLDLPLEVSVFYCRRPNEKKGKITALIQKNLLEVKGDGHSTIEQLIEAHPVARQWLDKSHKGLNEQMTKILLPGERYCLSHVANLFHGAHFEDLAHLIDQDLTDLFDEISWPSQFYYGRYDIKCTSVADIKKRKNFYILEFNGAGSVPNHIYAGNYSLWKAYKEIVEHWNWLYSISQYNHENGHPRWSLMKGHRFLQTSKKHFDVLKKIDKELVLQ